MSKCLVGSRAAKHWFPDFRKPSDIDYLISPGDKKIGDSHEVIGALEEFLQWDIAPPEALYTLKVSHSFWPHHWKKTMDDILFFQEKGVEFDHELFKKLYKVWEDRHGKKRAKLNVKNEDFFRPTVQRKYVHDTLHQAVKYYDEPMYKKLKKDQSMAMLDRKMFEALSFEDKCKTAREEIYVTALERFLIPNDFGGEILTSYQRACKLLITSMTSGYFPLFIVLNWIDLHKPDDHPFIELFNYGLENGIIESTKMDRR